MKPIPIKEIKDSPILFGKNQPEYQPLPAYKYKDAVIACWGLSWKERFKVFFSGRIFVSLKTWNKPLTPSYVSVSFEEIKNVE
jgi:hypothetical protein